jgi:hypothetical protein
VSSRKKRLRRLRKQVEETVAEPATNVANTVMVSGVIAGAALGAWYAFKWFKNR